MKKDYFEKLSRRKIGKMGLQMEGNLVAKEKFVNVENIKVYSYVTNKVSLHLYSLSCTRKK